MRASCTWRAPASIAASEQATAVPVAAWAWMPSCSPGMPAAITARAEATTCAGALAGYLTAGTPIPWALAGSLIVGGVVASVMGAATVRVMPERGLKWAIAGGCVVLGGLTLLKVLV